MIKHSGMFLAAAMFLATASAAHAQEAPTPEQLKKMYANALEQLEKAQTRKNELVTENEKLSAKVKQLEKDLLAARAELSGLKVRDSESAERSFNLRSHYAAWQSFIRANPDIMIRWHTFLESAAAPPDGWTEFFDADWPLSLKS